MVVSQKPTKIFKSNLILCHTKDLYNVMIQLKSCVWINKAAKNSFRTWATILLQLLHFSWNGCGVVDDLVSSINKWPLPVPMMTTSITGPQSDIGNFFEWKSTMTSRSWTSEHILAKRNHLVELFIILLTLVQLNTGMIWTRGIVVSVTWTIPYRFKSASTRWTGIHSISSLFCCLYFLLMSVISQIAKTFGSTSIGYRSHARVSDRCLINVDPMVFAVCPYGFLRLYLCFCHTLSPCLLPPPPPPPYPPQPTPISALSLSFFLTFHLGLPQYFVCGRPLLIIFGMSVCFNISSAFLCVSVTLSPGIQGPSQDKDCLSGCKDSHYKDKTALRQSYLYSGIPILKRRHLYIETGLWRLRNSLFSWLELYWFALDFLQTSM